MKELESVTLIIRNSLSPCNMGVASVLIQVLIVTYSLPCSCY